MKRINVAGIPYKVEWMPWKEVAHDGLAAHLFGEIDYVKHSIHVASDMPKEKQQMTFLHEALHAIINEYNIRELQEGEEHHEMAINQLSLGLLSVLKSLKLEIPYDSR